MEDEALIQRLRDMYKQQMTKKAIQLKLVESEELLRQQLLCICYYLHYRYFPDELYGSEQEDYSLTLMQKVRISYYYSLNVRYRAEYLEMESQMRRKVKEDITVERILSERSNRIRSHRIKQLLHLFHLGNQNENHVWKLIHSRDWFVPEETIWSHFNVEIQYLAYMCKTLKNAQSILSTSKLYEQRDQVMIFLKRAIAYLVVTKWRRFREEKRPS